MSVQKDVIICRFICYCVHEMVTQNLLKFIFQDDIFVCLVGKDELIIGNFTFLVKIAEDSYKRCYTGTTGQKYTFAFIFNGSPCVSDNQRISDFELTDLFSNS